MKIQSISLGKFCIQKTPVHIPITMEKSNKLNVVEDYDDGYDAVVVGSGYGGSVAACRMSMAGLKVCLLEKGRKWEAHDFPTDSLKISCATRFENRNLGVDFGPKDALFQVNIQGDSVAATACGLGGGSLVNAGVMLPTPVRARRNPRWPKDWEKYWDICEASASNMLRIQTIPTKFQNVKIMEQVIEEDYDKEKHNPLKLSMNFDIEQVSDLKAGSQETGSCLACGNCLSGCPYNAKNSTDKTYLASAIREGCIIKTGCEVQYVVRNEDDTCNEEREFKRKSKRRWLVYLKEFDYIASDIVVLSGGVLGTTKVLFQSQLRGLSVSKKLGSGLSCNGNNVAYLDGSSAPLNASGLNKKQFANVPFHERPGPSISSSYTSSLGFTIQSAVIPTSYPYFLFKGFLTYQCEYAYEFLHNIADKLRDVFGLKQGQSMVLNAMGYDSSDGELKFDKETNKIHFYPPHDPLLQKKVESFQKLAKKLGGNLFMSKYRSTSVHLLGGCIASKDASSGVCDHNGQVFDNLSPNGIHTGLYICDASIIPCSVGVNPSLTIATAAEHVSKHIVMNAAKHLNQSSEHRQVCVSDSKLKKSVKNLDVVVEEIMRGQIGNLPCTSCLTMRFGKASRNLYSASEPYPLLRGKVGGHVICKGIEMEKMYIIHGDVNLCQTDSRTPYTQYMDYHLVLAASSGSRYVLQGRKTLNPYLIAAYAWKESTTMNVSLTKFDKQDKTILKGKLHISPLEFVKTMFTLKGHCRGEFMYIFMQSLIRTYVLQVPRRISMDFKKLELVFGPYPKSNMHQIKTEDDITICCQHWESSLELKEEKKPNPVMLINGYATESYYLPTETNDLIRTLLKRGHDIWLLHSRLHVKNPPNDFSIEDFGRIDIPAAINKMSEFYGQSIRFHIIAHCAGGLAIHIALMGGHVSAKKIVSLSCTNSSMFFKVSTSSLFKMWLPLIPISMAILGKNKILQMDSTTSLRHRILKSIARRIPRFERCTCDECEVFSGIFGNAYWHENITHTLHCWMNKEYLQNLPMGAFPHLRRICNAGYILNKNGENVYLIHPERMSLPTLYVSGGRTLLVTPETTFLANKYMKLHQPVFRHERVVIDGFGHSDLLIGEKSAEKVFPHIMRHIALAEEEKSCDVISRECKYSKEALAWSVDPFDDNGGFESWIFRLISVLLILMLFIFFFYI